MPGSRTAPPARDFTGGPAAGGMRVIAEVKKASPSAGVIRPDFDPAAIASAYERRRGRALSVLTDEHFFQGHLRLPDRGPRGGRPARACARTSSSTATSSSRPGPAGADAVLLIAEILPGDRLADAVRARPPPWACTSLVELHDADQLPRVIDCGATLVGINNRDLRTFHTRLDHTLDLLPKVPPGGRWSARAGSRRAPTWSAWRRPG